MLVWLVCGWGWTEQDCCEWGGEQQARQDERLHCGRIEESWNSDLVGLVVVVGGGAR